MVAKCIIARRLGDTRIDCQSLGDFTIGYAYVDDAGFQIVDCDSCIAFIPRNLERLRTFAN